MSSQSIRKYIVIFDDYVKYPYDDRTKHPRLDGLSLARFSSLVLRFSRYGTYMRRTQKMSMSGLNDYDGTPLEDFYSIKYDSERERSSFARTSIRTTFRDVPDNEDKYDYVKMAVRGTPKPYMERSSPPPRETKFRVYSVEISRRDDDAEVWIRRELVRLEGIFDYLDKATGDLISWADSGLAMGVYCSSFGCQPRDTHVISNRNLLDYVNKGLSIDDLKERLKCKECGERCSGIGPV